MDPPLLRGARPRHRGQGAPAVAQAPHALALHRLREQRGGVVPRHLPRRPRPGRAGVAAGALYRLHGRAPAADGGAFSTRVQRGYARATHGPRPVGDVPARAHAGPGGLAVVWHQGGRRHHPRGHLGLRRGTAYRRGERALHPLPRHALPARAAPRVVPRRRRRARHRGHHRRPRALHRQPRGHGQPPVARVDPRAGGAVHVLRGDRASPRGRPVRARGALRGAHPARPRAGVYLLPPRRLAGARPHRRPRGGPLLPQRHRRHHGHSHRLRPAARQGRGRDWPHLLPRAHRLRPLGVGAAPPARPHPRARLPRRRPHAGPGIVQAHHQRLALPRRRRAPRARTHRPARPRPVPAPHRHRVAAQRARARATTGRCGARRPRPGGRRPPRARRDPRGGAPRGVRSAASGAARRGGPGPPLRRGRPPRRAHRRRRPGPRCLLPRRGANPPRPRRPMRHRARKLTAPRAHQGARPPRGPRGNGRGPRPRDS